MPRPEDTDPHAGHGPRGLPDTSLERGFERGFDRALAWARCEVTLTLPRWTLLAGVAAALALALVALD